MKNATSLDEVVGKGESPDLLLWRNWHTQQIENLSLNRVGVRVPPRALRAHHVWKAFRYRFGGVSKWPTDSLRSGE